MKSLLISIALVIAPTALASAQEPRPFLPVKSSGVQKPGWGKRERPSARHGAATVIDAAATDSALAVPHRRSFRGIEKPGFGIRR